MFRLLLLLFCLTGPLLAQADFSGDTKVPEGVYFSHAAFLAAQPDLNWEAIAGEMVQMPEDFRVQIGSYGYKDDHLDPDLMPYAISLDGVPYLFIRKNTERDYYEFTGLRVAGTISVIKYDTMIVQRQLMKAYNPANGQPFREAYVEREKKLTLTKTWHLPSGQILPLTRPNLLTMIGRDQELTKALKDLPEPTPDLLLRAVRLFDDRHPTPLPFSGSR